MTLLLIVLPAGFAVATAALCWRNRRRWRHIRARPVMTCEQVAGLPPGQFVVLTGRTSDGPLMKAPYTGRVCVGYRAKVSWHRDVGQNDFESDERVDSRGLPIRVADGTGAVNVSEYLAQRRLLRRRDGLLGQVSMYDRTIKDVDGKKVYTYLDTVIPASAAVFVTGITTRDTDGGPVLTYGHWADGAATLPPADLDPRVTRRIRRQAGLAVVCGAATAVLIGLRLWRTNP
jgi:hypothetical protein